MLLKERTVEGVNLSMHFSDTAPRADTGQHARQSYSRGAGSGRTARQYEFQQTVPHYTAEAACAQGACARGSNKNKQGNKQQLRKLCTAERYKNGL